MMSHAIDSPPSKEGTRERKQRETRFRIAESGLRLFLENGYDGTTVEAIAQAAGISRRTFFAYFKSKDEILFAWMAAGWEAVLGELLTISPDEAPLDAVRRMMVQHASRYESDEMQAIDRVMLASEGLKSQKQAGYAMQEATLYSTMCEVWRQPQRRAALRIVAMVSIGAMRLALEAWRVQPGERSLASYLEEEFALLQAEI